MYYTVYKITNLINDKIYIGVHKTEDINDDYMGSGKILKRAQEKYGIENFKKEILEVFNNIEDMFNMESQLVNEEFLKREDTYNLKLGGVGGWDHIDNTGNKHGDCFNWYIQKLKDPEFKSKDSKNKSERMKQLHKKGLLKYDNFKGKNHSDEVKKKISETQKMKTKGEKNSQFGTMWIYNLEEKLSKKIKKEEFPKYEKIGWLKGRKMKF